MSGIFGVVRAQGDCAETLLYGADYHSHLGTEYGGMAVVGEHFTRRIHQINQSQFKSKFYPEYSKIKGNKGIAVVSDCHEQPMYIHSSHGEFCIVTNGLLRNTQELARMLYLKGLSFSEFSCGDYNSAEMVAKLISQGSDIVDGIKQMFDVIDGSCSLMLLTREGVYAARDRFGFTPLVVGKSDDAWAVTTETTAFPNNGFKVVKYLEPGEIVLLSETGMEQKAPGGQTCRMCAFYWIYSGFPASDYEGINTEVVRERCGRCLAKRDAGELDCDLVAGVPDSGIAHAIGYSMESGKPLRRPLVKYTPGYGRSYTPPSQRTRDLIATMKLVAIREIINGNRIVLCEDSIVRGTQLKNFTVQKLREGGAREVHVRAACPPLMFPCRFCLSTRSLNELSARQAIRSLEGRDIEDVHEYIVPASGKHAAMVEWIRRDIGVDSLKFQTLEDMISAIGLPRDKLCTYCWTGDL
jgi:amidophosphoribosyltransferase